MAVAGLHGRRRRHRGHRRDHRRVGRPARLGLDSVIEGLASIIILWRFTGTRTLSQTAERRAQKALAVTFFLLAPYIAIDASHSLVTAETSWLGIGLSIASLIVMPLLGAAKKRIGARLDSRATIGEDVQNMLCAYLAAAVLAGLLANTWFGLWWGRSRHRARHRCPGRPQGPRSLGRRRRRRRLNRRPSVGDPVAVRLRL